jgi:hypothetical protein
MSKRRKIVDEPLRYDADIQLSNSILIMREMCRIQFMEKFEKELAPGIAKELMRLGVKFPDSGKDR